MAQIVKLRRSSVPGQKPTNTNLQLGELALNTTDGKVYMAKSGSMGPSVEELISTNTVNTGSVTISGSIELIGNQTINGNINITGSLTSSGLFYPTIDNGEESFLQTDGNGTLTFQYVKTLYESIVNGESFQIQKGTPLYVSGSAGANSIVYVADAGNPNKMPVIYISGDNIDPGDEGRGIALGLISGVNTTGYPAGTEIYVGVGGGWTSVRPTGSAIVQSLGIVTKEGNGGQGVVLNPGPNNLPNLNENNIWVGDTNSYPSQKTLNSLGFTTTGSFDSFTSSVVLTSQTGSMTVLSSSYALTASHVLNLEGSQAPIGTYSSLNVEIPSTTWSFNHRTGQRYPIFQVFDSNGDVVIPTSIHTIDENNAEIIFGSNQTGIVIASLGGGNGVTEEFTSSDLWIVNHNLGTDYPDVTIWDSNRNIIFPNRIESIDLNQIKIYFSAPISGHVSVSRGGHIISGSVDLEWNNILNKPSGLVSGSSQLTGSYDDRYVLSGSITQTTWNNIANKPEGIVSSSSQISYTGITDIPSGIISGSVQIDNLGYATTSSVNQKLDTGSFNSYTSSNDNKVNSLINVTGSFATTGSNAFKNNQIITGSLTVTGNGEFGGQAFSIIHNQGTVSTTTNINWDLSNVRTITLGASVITLTFSNPKPGATYTLIIKQDGTGNRTIGWPTIRWPGGTPPTLTSTLNSVDVVTLIYDGSTYYGAYINDLK